MRLYHKERELDNYLAAMPADERAAWEGYWVKLAAAIESTVSQTKLP